MSTLYKLQPKEAKLYTAFEMPIAGKVDINGEETEVPAGHYVVSPVKGGQTMVVTPDDFASSFVKQRKKRTVKPAKKEAVQKP